MSSSVTTPPPGWCYVRVPPDSWEEEESPEVKQGKHTCIFVSGSSTTVGWQGVLFSANHFTLQFWALAPWRWDVYYPNRTTRGQSWGNLQKIRRQALPYTPQNTVKSNGNRRKSRARTLKRSFMSSRMWNTFRYTESTIWQRYLSEKALIKPNWWQDQLYSLLQSFPLWGLESNHSVTALQLVCHDPSLIPPASVQMSLTMAAKHKGNESLLGDGRLRWHEEEESKRGV